MPAISGFVAFAAVRVSGVAPEAAALETAMVTAERVPVFALESVTVTDPPVVPAVEVIPSAVPVVDADATARAVPSARAPDAVTLAITVSSPALDANSERMADVPVAPVWATLRSRPAPVIAVAALAIDSPVPVVIESRPRIVSPCPVVTEEPVIATPVSVAPGVTEIIPDTLDAIDKVPRSGSYDSGLETFKTELIIGEDIF